MQFSGRAPPVPGFSPQLHINKTKYQFLLLCQFGNCVLLGAQVCLLRSTKSVPTHLSNFHHSSLLLHLSSTVISSLYLFIFLILMGFCFSTLYIIVVLVKSTQKKIIVLAEGLGVEHLPSMHQTLGLSPTTAVDELVNERIKKCLICY